MIPYEQVKAMADQRMQRYEAEAARHRSIDREESNLLERLISKGRQGLDRSGLGRIGDIVIGREARPAI
ncbi:MAG: hypothetical protein DWQ40_08410 [Actinobacteria bacterium]|nr:MAG: hypothetical protein DWQ40_08410 [Actinomycetota bacterium]